MENKNLKSLDRFIEEQYGTRGALKREKFEHGYEDFKLGAILHRARLQKGLTQSELAAKTGTNKGYISRIENNASNIRLSTLMRIVRDGLGGTLDFKF